MNCGHNLTGYHLTGSSHAKKTQFLGVSRRCEPVVVQYIYIYIFNADHGFYHVGWLKHTSCLVKHLFSSLGHCRTLNVHHFL